MELMNIVLKEDNVTCIVLGVGNILVTDLTECRVIKVVNDSVEYTNIGMTL